MAAVLVTIMPQAWKATSRPFDKYRHIEGQVARIDGLAALTNDVAATLIKCKNQGQRLDQTDRFNSDPRASGLVGSTPPEGKAVVPAALNGASPPCFCGVSRKLEIPEVVEAAAGSENAASEDPIIMKINISNIS